jgi:6-pyruvoyl-tetrahydropterin synthase
MRIGRTYRFEAAHFLPNVPDGHKCKNMHGHNYRVEIVFGGLIDDRGFVADFSEMDAEIMPLIRLLDHTVLNEKIKNPTAELIAEWFALRLPQAEAVRVYENDDCWAEH